MFGGHHSSIAFCLCVLLRYFCATLRFMIKHFNTFSRFAILGFLFLLLGCSEDEVAPAPVAAPVVEDDGYFFLKTSNAVEFLTQYGKDNPETKVQITTVFGVMKLKLYEETPLHRANFLMLVKEGYFNDTYFYRVAKDFVIQGGNTDLELTQAKRTAIGKYTIPNEILPLKYYHKRGALCAAREWENNPDKMSDVYNFYIVQGKKMHELHLDDLDRDRDWKIPSEQRSMYMSRGGAPHLDGEHTVFGVVYEGLDVIAKIADVEVDGVEWPKVDIIMQVEVIE
jgi:peptidyl-prolyl cis-trans isomerase B (cyclophilin B)